MNTNWELAPRTPYRIFHMDDGTATQIVVQISGLTLTGGDKPSVGGANGGVILNGENLTLTSSTLSGNSAPNGGGVINYGTVTITQSTLAGNSANYAGGVYISGMATITQSTIAPAAQSAIERAHERRGLTVHSDLHFATAD